MVTNVSIWCFLSPGPTDQSGCYCSCGVFLQYQILVRTFKVVDSLSFIVLTAFPQYFANLQYNLLSTAAQDLQTGMLGVFLGGCMQHWLTYCRRLTNSSNNKVIVLVLEALFSSPRLCLPLQPVSKFLYQDIASMCLLKGESQA